VKAVGWNRVVVGQGGRTLRLVYVGGIAPCYVLDHVATTLDRRAVTVTLYEGSDPAHPNAVCPEIAQLKGVDVKLPVPLGARRVIDGATSAR
ncbi:MAG: hypothetical protein H0U16_10145, partial [Actinobacteria bacterium]|nr:hypothetical protein [Actinomycetota bacterium]